MMTSEKQLKKRGLPLCLVLTFVLAVFLQTAQEALAADTLIEIFYLPHRPALAVVSEVEKVIAEFSDMTVKKYSFDDPDSKELVQQYNLSGHMPVAIFINGKNTFTVNGKQMNLRNFPKGNTFVPMFAGEWDYDNLRSILSEISGGK